MFQQGVNSNGEPLRDFEVKHDPREFGIDCSRDGMCRQEFAPECDINVLLAKYDVVSPLAAGREGMFVDWSNLPDLQEHHAIMQAASEAFMRLPAVTRREFDNDPVKFVAFAEDSKNLEQMRSWGLAPAAEKPADPVKVELVNPPETPQKAP